MPNLVSIVARLVLFASTTALWANAFLEMYKKKNNPLYDYAQVTTWSLAIIEIVLVLADLIFIQFNRWSWARIAFCLTVWAAVPPWAEVKTDPYSETVSVTAKKVVTILICGLVLTFTFIVVGLSYPT